MLQVRRRRGRCRRALPEAVEHFPVGLDPQHDVFCGRVMDEGALGVHKKHVGDPDLLHQPPVKRHAEVVGAGEGQPLVLPIVPQVEGHGEVLGQRTERGTPHTEPTGCQQDILYPCGTITWLGVKLSCQHSAPLNASGSSSQPESGVWGSGGWISASVP